MDKEYEVISYNSSSFNIFLVNMLYRTPHFHMDYEFLICLDGELTINTSEEIFSISGNDIAVLNPMQVHELSAEKPALALTFQLPPSLLTSICPEVSHIAFSEPCLRETEQPEKSRQIVRALTDIMRMRLDGDDFAPLLCVSNIFQIFYEMLQLLPWKKLTEKELALHRERGWRMQRIVKYIDENSDRKLSLKEIAEAEKLDLYYMSHLFKKSFGITFQEYVTKVRCEKARHRLLLTKDSLLDICISCGFSDPRYFNRDFERQYGMTPKEYRLHFNADKLSMQQKSMLSTQEFLSDEAARIALGRIRI